MSITKEKKQELIQGYATGQEDTGSVEVQCAILTERITSLTEHFKSNPHDFQSRRGLLIMVNKRRRLLRYLQSNDQSRYEILRNKLGIRK
jgi:small subunit ribosomal protein S15